MEKCRRPTPVENSIELKDNSILTYELISGNYYLVHSPRYYNNSFPEHKNCKRAGNFQSANGKQRGFYLFDRPTWNIQTLIYHVNHPKKKASSNEMMSYEYEVR